MKKVQAVMVNNLPAYDVYISISWYDIPELVVPIMISVIEVAQSFVFYVVFCRSLFFPLSFLCTYEKSSSSDGQQLHQYLLQ
jgi:hypothetical protein